MHLHTAIYRPINAKSFAKRLQKAMLVRKEQTNRNNSAIKSSRWRWIEYFALQDTHSNEN